MIFALDIAIASDRLSNAFVPEGKQTSTHAMPSAGWVRPDFDAAVGSNIHQFGLYRALRYSIDRRGRGVGCRTLSDQGRNRDFIDDPR